MSAFDDWNMIVFLTGGVGPCSLDRSPKSNWVQKNGGLPNYICHIARAITTNGHSISEAIPMAIGTAKRWAAGGTTNGMGNAKHVHPATAAKAAAAVAQWEALRAKAHAGKVIKASHPQGGEYLMLTDVGSFNTDMVRQAYNHRNRDLQTHGHIVQLHTDHIIAGHYNEDDDEISHSKIPYTVEGNTVNFGDAQPVKETYSPLPGWKPIEPDTEDSDDKDDPGDDLTPEEEQRAKDENPYPGYGSLERITSIAGY